ncbi:MAG TPA: hypothetical protein VFW12_00405, partial [Candidatus Limnocylindria bacterium]|nr:hypothetical protein [Candidatus Limnocylindria bacterium]
PSELAQEAIDVLDGLEETVELGRAIANLAGLRMVARADTEAVALAERAHAIGERFGDTWTTANALITKGTALRNLSQGGRAEGKALMTRGLELAKEAGLAEVALRAYNNLVIGADIEPAERDRVLAEGIEYAERHGIEQPMLLASRAFDAFLRGDWDESLAVGERVPEGSFWHDGMVVATRINIALGRQGPGAALPMARRSAEKASRGTEAQRTVLPLAQMVFVAAMAEERAECETWMRELRGRAERDPGVLRLLAQGPVHLAAGAAAYLGDRGLVDLLGPAVPADEDGEGPRLLLAAASAFFARDAAECGRATTRYNEFMQSKRFGYRPSPLLFARELRRAGVPLGPEWREPLARMRDHLERARADWLLAELAKIEA